MDKVRISGKEIDRTPVIDPHFGECVYTEIELPPVDKEKMTIGDKIWAEMTIGGAVSLNDCQKELGIDFKIVAHFPSPAKPVCTCYYQQKAVGEICPVHDKHLTKEDCERIINEIRSLTEPKPLPPKEEIRLQKCSICGLDQPYVIETKVCLGCLKKKQSYESPKEEIELPEELGDLPTDLAENPGHGDLVVWLMQNRNALNQLIRYLRRRDA